MTFKHSNVHQHNPKKYVASIDEWYGGGFSNVSNEVIPKNSVSYFKVQFQDGTVPDSKFVICSGQLQLGFGGIFIRSVSAADDEWQTIPWIKSKGAFSHVNRHGISKPNDLLQLHPDNCYGIFCNGTYWDANVKISEADVNMIEFDKSSDMGISESKIPENVRDKIYLPYRNYNEYGHLFGHMDIVKFVIDTRENDEKLSKVYIYRNGTPIQYGKGKLIRNKDWIYEPAGYNFGIPQRDDEQLIVGFCLDGGLYTDEVAQFEFIDTPDEINSVIYSQEATA